jgi:hypothetical protein
LNRGGGGRGKLKIAVFARMYIEHSRYLYFRTCMLSIIIFARIATSHNMSETCLFNILLFSVAEIKCHREILPAIGI